MMEKRSTSRWGNSIGYALIPLWMRSENDIFEYIRRAKTTMDRKKLSLEPLFSYLLLKLTVRVFGFKVRWYIIFRAVFSIYKVEYRIKLRLKKLIV